MFVYPWVSTLGGIQMRQKLETVTATALTLLAFVYLWAITLGVVTISTVQTY